MMIVLYCQFNKTNFIKVAKLKRLKEYPKEEAVLG